MKLIWERLEGRDGHTVGRELLQKLMGQVPEIRVTDRGKPYFADSSLHFSISHCKNHAFCAIGPKNLGIDGEEMGRNIDLRLADKILSPPEKARFDAAPDKRAALLGLWVQKEAYAKLTGRGWGSYLYETDFTPENVQIIDGCFVAVMEE